MRTKLFTHLLCLLCSLLLLPGAAQAQTGTKAAPSDPTFPYTLTIVQPDAGKGSLAATIDGTAGTPATVHNGTTVTVAFTPSATHVFKTGSMMMNDVALTADPDNYGVVRATFVMPAEPVTLTADALVKVTAVEGRPSGVPFLPEEMAGEDEAAICEYLTEKFPSLTLIPATGEKRVLELTWTYGGPIASFDPAAGEMNTFKWKSASFPDDMDASGMAFLNQGSFSGEISVVNYAAPIQPVADGETTVTASDFAGSDRTSRTGRLQGEAGKPTKSLSITAPDAAFYTYLTLNQVTVSETTTITAPLNLSLQIEGTDNNLGALTVGGSGSTTLYFGAGSALAVRSFAVTSGNTSINNTGGAPIPSLSAVVPKINDGATFSDYTGSISRVTDEAGTTLLALDSQPATAFALPGGDATLQLNCKAAEGFTMQYLLQRLDPTGWYTVMQNVTGISTGTYTIPSTEAGRYRIRATATRAGSSRAAGQATTITLLSSVVEVKEGYSAETTYHTVTLPRLTGATLDAGDHTVEDGYDFTFKVKVNAGYDKSTPIVTVTPKVEGRTETLQPVAQEADNTLIYRIMSVDRDLVISISGIVKNPDPTGNATIDGTETRVWTAAGQLHIYSPAPARVEVYNYGGSLFISQRVSGGNTTMQAPFGASIVRVNDKVFKVIH